MAEQVRKRAEQLVVPARSEHKEVGRPPVLAPESVRYSEEYLVGYGWKKVGTNDSGYSLWEDPKAGEKSSFNIIKLPNKEYGYDQVKQLVLPPLTWVLTTEIAMQRQRERNMAGETLEQSIERKESELDSLYKAKQAKEELAAKTAEESSKQAVA